MKYSTVICGTCGAEFEKLTSQLRPMNFCSRACFREYASKRMSEMNRALNPERMNSETKAKLRAARLNSGAGQSYEKMYGTHTHRQVVEEMIGRPLKPGEVVHHIDGDKRNNSRENLMLFASQAEHARWHSQNDPNWGRKKNRG